MVKNIRVTLRKRTPYSTASKQIRVVKTPGGRLVAQYISKRANGPKCGDCGTQIHGIPHLRPVEYSRVNRRDRTVTRAYGGSRCGTCTKNRIIRAFLVQEKKVAKKADKAKKARAAPKKTLKQKQAEAAAKIAKAKIAKAKAAAQAQQVVAEELKKGSKLAKKVAPQKHRV